MKTLGQKIKQLRKKQKMTQSELGKILNIAKSNVSQYENNINTPDINMLKKISKVFDVSLDYLVGFTNDNKIKNDKDEQKKKSSKFHKEWDKWGKNEKH